MANHNSTVVGIFMDDSWAQGAIQALQAAGFQARVADNATVGNLASMGIDRNVTSLYQSRLSEGSSVVIIDDAGNRGEDALGIMLQNGAENIDLSKDQTANANYYQQLQSTDVSQRQYGQYDQTRGRAYNAEEMRLRLHEESLTAVKQAVQAGEVQVSKVVHERQQEVPVTLRHEEVVIERHAVNQPADPNDIGDMTDQVISVPVYEERAELQKQARVREEVTIGKQATEEQQVLTGTTRHEHIDVQQSGDVVVEGGTQANVGFTDTDTTTNRNR